MISYNKQVLNEIFNSIAELIDANVSIFDAYEHYSPVANFGNKSTICTSLRYLIDKNCAISDSNSIRKCLNDKKPFTYHCHLGFNEIIIPFTINETVPFFVIVGPLKQSDYEDIIKNNISSLLENEPERKERMLSYLGSTPVLTQKKYDAIIRIVNAIVENGIKNKQIIVKDNFIENKLNPYLEENISKQIYISDISSKFFYSPKQLETTIKEYSGMSPKKYILKFKINVAKELLISTSKDLQQIALDVGFADYNYFIKVFKTFAGDTPLQYRKRFALNAY